MSSSRMFAKFRAYDVVALLILAPLVIMLAASIPDDVANHQGRTLRGSATVVRTEPLRGGEVAVFEVSSASGDVVGTTENVYGGDARSVGSSFPVMYVPPGSPAEDVAAYAVGEDPLAVNLSLLLVTASAWLVALGFVVGRLRHRIPRRISRHYRSTGSYEARPHRGMSKR